MGQKKINGFGDVVAKVTKFIGVEPCESCLKRQELWNNIFPIKLKPRELTLEELNSYRELQAVRTLRLDNTQRKYLCKIYSDVFRVPYFEPCVNCDASPYLRMIERMDKIIKTYEEI